MAAFEVLACVFLDLWLECIGVAVLNRLYCLLPLFVAFFIAAIGAVTLRATAITQSEAITVELQAFGLFTIA